MRCWLVALVLAVVGCASRAKAPSSSSPPITEERDFWKTPAKSLIVTRPVSGRLQVALVRILAEHTYEIVPPSMREYHAIPLDAYLASRKKELGIGDHLIITNVRGEQLYLTLENIREAKPVIVVGIDDVHDLSRWSTTYQLKREYSFKETNAPPPPKMIRAVGSFLFFPDGGNAPAAAELEDTTTASFTLTPSSFRLVKDDPLRATRSLSPELQSALSGGDGCLKCHSLRGAGAHAHHVRASDGKAHGGFALGLDEYPRDVLRRFLFEQETVAAGFGVEPLPVDPKTATALFDAITTK